MAISAGRTVTAPPAVVYVSNKMHLELAETYTRITFLFFVISDQLLSFAKFGRESRASLSVISV